MRRAPEQPVGWPMAMAPPLGFTFAMSGRYSRSQASTTEAKASLISTTSMSSSDSLALLSTSSVAGMTAVSMIWGSLAATAKVWKRARGVSPSDDARSSLMISTAAAPSEICDDVPAVTRARLGEGGLEAGQLLERGVAAHPLVGARTARSPRPRPARRDGPAPRAARSRRRSGPRPAACAARWCERSANSSMSSRVIFQRRAISSAHSP